MDDQNPMSAASRAPGLGSPGRTTAVPMIVHRDLPIPMDDGIVLRADVFLPPEPGAFPVVMSLGPYGKSLPFQSAWFASRWERLLADHPALRPELVPEAETDSEVLS